MWKPNFLIILKSSLYRLVTLCFKRYGLGEKKIKPELLVLGKYIYTSILTWWQKVHLSDSPNEDIINL